jgi:hypothetical protein
MAIPAGYQEAVGTATGRAPVTVTAEPETAGGGFPTGLVAIVAAVSAAGGAVVMAVLRRRQPIRRRLAEFAPGAPETDAEELAPSGRWRRVSIAGLGRRLFRRSGMRRVARLKRHH